MAIYMSKKISTPVSLTCVSFNEIDGFIAIGGQGGFLKVFKLESVANGEPAAKGLAAASTLSLSCVLEGHHETITVLAWNDKHKKLTTGDQNGNIIVWILSKNTWCEEMVNHRNKSVVMDLKWTHDGFKICIGYLDGNVIVGSVEGNRIWGKELKNTQISSLQWSPDSKKILFAVNKTSIHLYDNAGNFMFALNNYSQSITSIDGISQTLFNKQPLGEVVALDWFCDKTGHVSLTTPILVVAYNNGICQLTKDEYDESPIVFQTGLHNIVDCKWNNDGSIIGIVGQDAEEKSFLHLYDIFGQLSTKLCLPGKDTTCFAWDKGSIRLAFGIDSYLYLANQRIKYKYAYFSDTLVFMMPKSKNLKDVLIFWDNKRKMIHKKTFANLVAIEAYGDFCCVINVLPPNEDQISTTDIVSHTLTLINCIGTPIATRQLDNMKIDLMDISANHVVVCSHSAFYVWQFKDIKNLASLEVSGNRKSGLERLYHIDDITSGAGSDNIDFKKLNQLTKDKICALAISDKYLIVGRKSGSYNKYRLPELFLELKGQLDGVPKDLFVNSDSSCLACLDEENRVTFYKLDEKSSTPSSLEIGDLNKDLRGYKTETGPINRIRSGTGDERKYIGTKIDFILRDAWDFMWADDNPDMFVVMIKTKMHFYTHFVGEEPITSSGYLCEFRNLNAISAFLDDLIDFNESNQDALLHEALCSVECKCLQITRSILYESGPEEAIAFAEKNQHPTLWKMIAKSSLNILDLKSAQFCFTRAQDLCGIQFVNRLHNLQNDNLKKAEISTFYSDFEESQRIYLKMDRKDLAIGLQKKLGEYMKVLQLLKSGCGGISDYQIEEACNALGDQHAEEHNWALALQCYIEAQNYEGQARCNYLMENFDDLKSIVQDLPENHPFLEEIGNMFVSVGMCPEAVQAYLKGNKIQTAVDACIRLNHWALAIELAKTHNMTHVDGLLMNYLKELIDNGKEFEVIELYNKANHFLEAAKILYQMADKESKKHDNPLLVKKLYILAATLVDKHRDSLKSNQKLKNKKKNQDTNVSLAGLLETESSANLDSQLLSNPWRGAEAYHFLILAYKQLYSEDIKSALLTSLQLSGFDDMLDPVDVYSFIALVSASNKAFDACSKAFIKLENLECLSETERKHHRDLAVDIFYKNNIKNVGGSKYTCIVCQMEFQDTYTTCPHCQTKFNPCIVSGRIILSYQAWTCQCCKRCAYPEMINNYKACPLCHVKI